MNVYVISVVVFVATLTILLGLTVHLSNRSRMINMAFSFFTATIVLWIVSNFLTDFSKDAVSSLFWCRVSFASASLISLSFLYFSFVFPRRSSIKRATMAITTVVSVAVVSLCFSPYIVQSIQIYEWGANTINGKYFLVFPLYFITIMLFGFVNLYRKYRRSEVIERTQIQYVFLGTSIAAVIGLGTNIVLPLITGSTQYAKYGSFSTAIFLFLVSYAIIKHRLMDIRALVIKSVVYSILLGTLSGFFALLVYFVNASYATIINRELLFVIGALFATFAFQPLRRLLERLTDKVFAKRKYDQSALLKSLGSIISTSVQLGELSTKMLETLMNGMKLTKAAIIIGSDQSDLYIKNVRYGSHSKSKWKSLISVCLEAKEAIVADEYDDGSKEKEILRNLDVSLAIPMYSEDEQVGVIALGEKRSGDMFDLQDIKLLDIIAPEAAIAIQHARLFEQKETRIRELDALSRLSLNLGSTLDLASILNMIVDEAIEATGAENGSIMLIEDDGQMLSIKASRGIDKNVARRTKVKIGEGIAGWVCKENKPIVIVNGKHDNKYIQQCLKNERISSSLTAPLRVKEKVIGVLCINRQKKKDVFTEESLRLMNSFAAHAAEAIENARLFENLEQTFLGTISALAKAVDARDRYTFGHSEEVTRYAVEIGSRMGLSQEEVNNIKIASRLHDIGKIGISDAILNKPGRLTADERKIIEQHPKIAVKILKTVDMLKDVIPLILYHHEHYDGKGYPTGLACEAIPVGARIITVADSFNAMTSNRPYSNPKSIAEAITELKECAGTQFDPKVVVAFLEILAEEHGKDEWLEHELEAILSSA